MVKLSIRLISSMVGFVVAFRASSVALMNILSVWGSFTFDRSTLVVLADGVAVRCCIVR